MAKQIKHIDHATNYIQAENEINGLSEHVLIAIAKGDVDTKYLAYMLLKRRGIEVRDENNVFQWVNE